MIGLAIEQSKSSDPWLIEEVGDLNPASGIYIPSHL
jgi:hypothetical protein